MSNDSSKVADALRQAHDLVERGTPVFLARLSRDGDPMPPTGWEKTEPDHAIVDKWRKGLALCAVTGVTFDVLDIDPRNGGKASFDAMSDELGDDGPEVFWRVKTPSGGLHLYVAPMDIGSHNGFRPGLDLKGGHADGSSRGFVFLPPTVRKSKVTGKPAAYAQSNGHNGSALNGRAVSVGPLSDYIGRSLAERAPAGTGDAAGVTSGRRPLGELRAACLAAEAGSQRDALLRYVHELERKGTDPDVIIELCVGLDLKNYNPRRPWTERDFRTLLHKEGEVIGDATDAEMGGEVVLNRISKARVSRLPGARKESQAEQEFWNEREDLAQIRQWARAQMVSPWALLGEVLADVVCRVPPTFVLPRIITGYGTLNMLLALTGSSSAGKGGASAVAQDAIVFEDGPDVLGMTPERIPLGSGEGLAKNYGYWSSKDSCLIRPVFTSIPTCYEIDTFAAIVERGGATLTAELRKFFSGETLGFGYGDPSKRVVIERFTYRGVLVAGVQPERSGIILGETGSGFAQRWLWLNAHDPYAPDVQPACPAPLRWSLPRELEDLDPESGKPDQVMSVCSKAVAEIRSTRLPGLRGTEDKLKAHALYKQEKFAAALALLGRRVELTETDWDMAAYAQQCSDVIREQCEEAIQDQARDNAVQRGSLDGIRYAAAQSATEREKARKLKKWVMDQVPTTGRISKSAIGRKRPNERKAIALGLAELVSEGKLVTETDTYQSQQAEYYRRPGR